MKMIILYVVMSISSVDGGITSNAEEHDFQPLSWQANTTQEYDKAWDECKLMEAAYRQLEAVNETDCYPIEGEE